MSTNFLGGEEIHFAFISFHIIFIGSIFSSTLGVPGGQITPDTSLWPLPVAGALVETTPRLVEVEMAEWKIDLVRCVRQVKVPRALTRGP